MIIGSWNVNSVRARIENIKDYLKKFSPDILMMQEIKTPDETYPYDDIQSLKYENYVFGQKSYNGVAIISKKKLDNIKNDIFNDKADVIVCDGFVGNVALKTAEGTANFITSELRKAMTGNLIGKFSSALNFSNLNKFKKRLDPRLYNGAILLGLDSAVVKSHGSSDHIGFANSLKLCVKIISG